MFLDNPILGVGTGCSWFERIKYGRSDPAHTEFTRLLSEHGLFGVAAIIMMLLMGLRNMRCATTVKGKAIAVSMLTYSMLFMAGTGMRLALPDFTFGLAAVTILLEKKTLKPAAVPTTMPPLHVA